ncbi:hypothetical protein [Microbispora rosea]|uniref:hypothetical protein n=1 Tax=Microbispora rosea TaxID=58117 RepID=UPI0039C6439C
MIAARAASERREILRQRRAELLRRVEQARAALEVVECALGCDHDDVTGCAHFQQAVLERIGLPAPAPPAPDVRDGRAGRRGARRSRPRGTVSAPGR